MSKVFMITEGLENMGAIKTGGQGSVYKGKRVGEIITAIKLLPTPILTQDENDSHYRDFTNEVKKLQRVNEEPNPNVVKILSYGVSETGCFPFIEMEYIDGPDLGELLKESGTPVFTIKEVIRVAEHLSHALAHCHKLDVKHGDIKSNNIKYNRHTGNYVLLDFGLAILSDEERRTSLRHAGAIEFMAPEQNEGRMFFQTDVYSFGIVLYELLAGKVPFLLDGNSETARNRVMIAHMETPPPDLLSLRAAALPVDWPEDKKALEMQVPDWLLKLVYKCLEKSPEARFENGIALHEYISLHHLYTAEVAGIVQNEDHKWKAVVADKDYELQDLKAIVSRQDKELQMLRQKNFGHKPVPVTVKQGGVSRSVFNALLLLLLVVGALAVYGLFFNRPVVSGANTEKLSGGEAVVGEDEERQSKTSENSSAAKREQKDKNDISGENKKADNPPVNESAAIAENKEEPTPVKNDSTSVEESSDEDDESPKRENTEPEKTPSKNVAQYKVRDKAYFHNEPDPATKRRAFIIHWNDAVLVPQDEKNGFIYVVFVNHLGQTSKGWLSKDELIKVK
ncbi:serine/threonine protein kinase [Flavisolibacter sp. BT320]|nr:serine/threonine protein kinase [Flavisolibacter longurius]